MTILDIYQNIGINDPIRSAPIFGPDVEGNTISGTVIPITKQDKEEGINTLRDLGNEYGTLTQADKNRLNTIFNSQGPLKDTDKAFLEKEVDQLYTKIPQVANNNARTLLTDGVSNNYNGTYSDAFNDLNKLLSKVDNVFNTDKNDVVADAQKAFNSLMDGIDSNSLIADPLIVNDKINEDWRELQYEKVSRFDLQGAIRDVAFDARGMLDDDTIRLLDYQNRDDDTINQNRLDAPGKPGAGKGQPMPPRFLD